MPSPFAITTATNSLPLDSNRQGQTSFTVSNTTRRATRGRAHLVARPDIAMPWLKLLGEAERNFASDETGQYGVQITVPPSAPDDDYTFRLDMVDVANPDDDFSEGPTVRFVVAPSPPVKKRFPWLIVAVVVGLLILLGGGSYGIIRQALPKAALTPVPTLVPTATPAAIPTQGLALWLKSDTGTTLNGSTVSQWTDQSGNGHNVRQSTTSNQPLLVKNTNNGKPVLRFDGKSDIMSTPAIVTTSTQYTLFVVSTLGNYPTAASQFGVPGPFYNGNSSNSGYGLFRGRYPNVNNVVDSYGTLNGGIVYNSFGVTISEGLQILEDTRDSNGNESFYVNGTQSGSTIKSMPNTPTGVTYVGGVSSGASDLFNGDIAEVIFYDHSLSTAERQSVEQYLKNRYSL